MQGLSPHASSVAILLIVQTTFITALGMASGQGSQPLDSHSQNVSSRYAVSGLAVASIQGPPLQTKPLLATINASRISARYVHTSKDDAKATPHGSPDTMGYVAGVRTVHVFAFVSKASPTSDAAPTTDANEVLETVVETAPTVFQTLTDYGNKVSDSLT